MKKSHLLVTGILLAFSTFVISQNKMPALGMQSGAGNFTTLSPRASTKVSPELLKNATEQAKKHPDFGILPLDAPCKDCYEVIDKRTESSRYFVKNRNEYMVQKAYGVINYKDKNGFLREKDISIYATPAAGIYASNNQEEPVSIDLNVKSMSINTLNHIDLKINNNLELWGVDKEGNETFISASDWSKATVGSNGLRVNDLFKGISMEAFALAGSVKTNYLISSYSTAYSAYKWLVIKDNVTTTVNSQFEFDGTKEANGLYNCDVNVVAGSKSLIAKIHKGVIFDHARSNVSSLYYKENNGRFEMYIDVDYLKNKSLTYPVVVDPLVTSSGTLAQASITGSMYNTSCNFTNSCDYNLTVNSPANATITGVSFSMAYQALGLCWQSDGAMRVTYNSCVSPSQTGYYWFCNSIGTGTCTGTNLSIYTDIASCIPPPSCLPIPMNFTLQLFRSCYGATGCASDCIRAAAPWSITITGKTLETLSNTTTGNGVTTQVAACNGTSLLNPVTTGGVGPYTYTWNPSGANTPTFTATSVTSSQTITCDVADACGVVRTATFTVNPNPSVPSAAVLPTQTLTSCNPSATIAPTYTSTSTLSTYVWQGPGVTGASNSASVTVNQPGIYTVSYTNTAGCSAISTYTVMSGPPTVSVTAVTASISCTNPTAVIAPVYTPPADLTFSWTAIGTGSISGSSTGGSIVVTQPGLYQVSITNTLTNCQGVYTYTVADETQVPVISSIPTQTISCNSLTVTIAPSYTPSTGLTYSWSGPGLPSPSTSAGISATQAGTFTVLATAANGCTATAQYNVVSSVVVLTATTQSLVLACDLTPASLSVQVTPPGSYIYNWTGPGIVSGATTTTPLVNAVGNYMVNVFDLNGCNTSAVANVSVPVINAGFSPALASGLAPFDVNFVNESVGASVYQWIFGDGKTAVAQNPSNTYQSPGTYTVMLVASNGTCKDTAYGVIIIDEGALIEVPNVFTPNGDNANDVFVIKTTGIKEMDLDIFNRWGEKLHTASGVNASWNGSHNSKSVSEGTYFYVIKAVGNDGKTYEKKGTVNLFK